MSICTFLLEKLKYDFKIHHHHKHQGIHQMLHDYNCHQLWKHTCEMYHPCIQLKKTNKIIYWKEVIGNKLNSILPITEFFVPKAQIQAHSGGTVNVARAHWLST